jgi:hypothetical protein
MIAIKDMEMPKSCVRCFTKGLRGLVGCELLTDDNSICVETRHPDCPLKEIVTCENCKHNGYSSVIRIYCKLHKWYPCSNYYCADGERRE